MYHEKHEHARTAQITAVGRVHTRRAVHPRRALAGCWGGSNAARRYTRRPGRMPGSRACGRLHTTWHPRGATADCTQRLQANMYMRLPAESHMQCRVRALPWIGDLVIALIRACARDDVLPRARETEGGSRAAGLDHGRGRHSRRASLPASHPHPGGGKSVPLRRRRPPNRISGLAAAGGGAAAGSPSFMSRSGARFLSSSKL